MEKVVKVPEGIDVSINGPIVKIKGSLGELEKKLDFPNISISYDDKERDIRIFTKRYKRKYLSMLGTIEAHLKNMILGVQRPFVFKMEAVYAHFPMTIKVQENKVIIQNFLGERHPRKVEIIEGVSVKIEGSIITLSGINKENVGQMAARIEKACYKGNRDPRKFQDGIYPKGWVNEEV